MRMLTNYGFGFLLVIDCLLSFLYCNTALAQSTTIMVVQDENRDFVLLFMAVILGIWTIAFFISKKL